MNHLSEQLGKLQDKVDSFAPIKVMIIGLGSVGNYLAEYLVSQSEFNLEIHIAGRSFEKAEPDMNIIRVSSMIRGGAPTQFFFHQLDLNQVEDVAELLGTVRPDFIVNSSRAYSGLKYGSISWQSIRAYGLWTPLAVRYIRNIMIAYDMAGIDGIVINTSYSDAVNPWLKSAGLKSPSFGSGNLNHLIPRIRLAAMELGQIENPQSLEITLATGHFHDVVISKEGHYENVLPLLNLSVNGRQLNLDVDELFRKCAIVMPSDAKRNKMNASSNFEIIWKLLSATRQRSVEVIHSPGVVGKLGGYPLRIDASSDNGYGPSASIMDDYFSLEKMEMHNQQSMALDGIEGISGGTLFFTDTLLERVRQSFSVDLPKSVAFEAVDETARLIIEKIISPSVSKQ